MEKLIRFGNFLISPNSQKELMDFEVGGEIKRLGDGWRMCKKEEFKYILGFLFIHKIGKKFGFKEGDRIKDGKIYHPLYSFEEGGIFYVDNKDLFEIFPSEEDIENFTLNYVFVKDI